MSRASELRELREFNQLRLMETTTVTVEDDVEMKVDEVVTVESKTEVHVTKSAADQLPRTVLGESNGQRHVRSH
jgi:hypothetical protein